MLPAYDLLYYIYILLFGVYTSMKITGGALSKREWRLFAVSSLVLLLAQGICLQLLGMDRLWTIYPLIVHLPIMLIIIFALKVKWDAALIAVVISYSLCQLPRWIGLVLRAFMLKPLAHILIHLACSHLVLVLLSDYCLESIHDMICELDHPLAHLGALPGIYYLYEYFMRLTGYRHAGIQALNELLPTGLVFFFILFTVAYQREIEKLDRAKYQSAVQEMKLKQSQQEIVALRAMQDQTAIHRHDLRHHLMMIESMLASGEQQQAITYIRQAESEIDRIVPMRHCDHETVNLLLCAFQARSQHGKAALRIKAALPQALSLPDTELCSLLSNGLENAINAVERLPQGADGTIDVFCAVKQSTLLIEIKNPYAGEIAMQDGLPTRSGRQRSYGCRSIQSIVQHRKGTCIFDASHGIFTLRIAIPLDKGNPPA